MERRIVPVARSPGATVPQAPGRWPPRGPVRVLLLHDYVTVVELIRLTLNHGPYATEVAATPAQAVSILEGWKPHVIILDMDLDAQQVIERIGSKPGGGLRIPVIGLTRRGDLKRKLAAFDAGVDDIMTSPFAPEELLARVIALLRRTYSETVAFMPTIRLGELEVDILNRLVRAGTMSCV